MKIRTKYISNSSSSSYIVPRDLTAQGVACIKLSTASADKFKASSVCADTHVYDSFSELWLTRPIKEYESDEVYALMDSIQKEEYCCFQMDGTPYDESYFFGYKVGCDIVYMHIQHITDELMTRTQLCRFIKNKFCKDQKFILNFSENCITLTISKED